MNKKYLYYFFLALITHNTFGTNKVLVPIPPKTADELLTNTPPDGFNREKCEPTHYKDMDLAMQCIVDQLQPKIKKNRVLYNYTKKRLVGSDQNYTIIRFINPTLNTNHYYYFEWKKKSYSGLKGLEKHVADYYKANKSSKLEFLYPYKRTDKNELGEIDKGPWASPWAIKIDNVTHSLLWKETDIQNSSLIDPFLTIESKDQNKRLMVLVDEKNNILAKRINESNIYRQNK